MPRFHRRNNRLRPRRKRRFKRRPLYRRNRSRMTRAINVGTIMPDRFYTSLIYFQSFRLDTAFSGLPAYTILRGNTMFDPETAVGGGQPQGFDQLMAFYKHYYVVSSSIICKALETTTGGSLFVVLPSRNGTAPLNADLEASRQKAKYRNLGQGTASRIRNAATTKSMLPFKNSQLLGSDAVDASDQWYWKVLTDAVFAGSEAVTDVTVEVYYNVIFYERKDLVAS